MSTLKFTEDRKLSLKQAFQSLFVLLVSFDLFASCPPPAPETEHWEWSTHVFSALVLETKQISDCEAISQEEQICRRLGVEVSFKVLELYKGDEPKFNSASIKAGGLASQYLKANTEYLLLVRKNESGVWIGGCSPPIKLGSEVEEVFWRRLNLGIQERTLREISEANNEN